MFYTKVKMMQKLIVLLVAISILSGCGATNSLLEATTSTVFKNSGGVYRIKAASDGSEGVGITPEVARIVKEYNANSSTGNNDLDLSNYALISSNTLGIIRKGTFTSGGVAANVTIIANSSADDSSGVLWMGIPQNGQAFILTAGGPLVGTPSGSFTYTGQHAAGQRRLNSAPEIGSFTIQANFNTGRFSYSGATVNTALSGTGLIDKVNGRLSGEAFTMSTPQGIYGAVIHGNFHGSNAADVAGVFHTYGLSFPDADADYAGGFVGSR